MKKQLLAILFVAVSGIAVAQTTPEKTNNYPEFTVNGKLGFARLKSTGNAPLNGNINGSDVMVAFKLGRKFDIATGVGYFEFNGNTTVAGNSASLKNSYLRIPLQFSGDFNLFKNEKPENDKLFFTVGVGVYANTLLKQELETALDRTSTKNMGWNFGLSSQVGLKFILSDAFNIGIGLESQSDFSKMKKDGAEQKIEQFNGLYFKLGLKF
ncbi:hypothetical protein [Flavobacterium sp. XGLA_31]|uniref:hypothetical protein n=1 Tax=Flavobacterium sp. XGLA_31 TaxID=3447666 RepID=UPI003F33BD7B